MCNCVLLYCLHNIHKSEVDAAGASIASACNLYAYKQHTYQYTHTCITEAEAKKRANAARGKGKGDSTGGDTPSSDPADTQPGAFCVDPLSGLTHSEIDRAAEALTGAVAEGGGISQFFAPTPADQRPPPAPAFGRAASSSNLATAHVRTLRSGVYATCICGCIIAHP